jgi:hypothetical protein
MLMSVAEEDSDGGFNPAAALARRTTASGNLGTRTLGFGRRSSSGGDGGGGVGVGGHVSGGHVSSGFLHRRMSGVGGLPSSSTAGGGGGSFSGVGGGGFGGGAGDVGSVDGESVAGGSLAGASSTTRRKRFGVLRKMLGLNE